MLPASVVMQDESKEVFVSASPMEKVQLSVRVSAQVAQLLDTEVAKASRNGQRITKERLVSDAIVATYSESFQDGDWLPVHHGEFKVQVDPRSNSALLDLLDADQTP